MKTKTIFNFLAFAMLTAAMVLTTACSGSEDLADNKPETTEPTEPVAKKGYELPVTINVTRQGDDATRATFDGSKLNFSDGDKLFVYGNDNSVGGAGQFAGTLDYVSEGTFSGTIYTENPYSGTADALFTAASAGENLTATLLPNNYESTGFLSIDNKSTTDIAYDDRLTVSGSYAFVASETAKATGVEQLSLEQASTYSSGFALSPENAILNFTITGLESGAKDVSLQIHHGFEYTVTGSVTPNASGVATFAIGVPNGSNIKDMDNNLTVGSSNFTLPSSTTFAAGKIYNITRYANIISGKFTVNASGDKVYFSKSNLQAKATYVSSTQTTWEWHFADTQYARVGTGANVYINGNGKVSSEGNGLNVDLFGWSTASTYLGINNSTNNNDYQYNNKTDGSDFVDWGSHADVIAGIGTGWRTLTSDEWRYLMLTRSGNRFAKAQLNVGSSTRCGIILLPDDWNTSYYSLSSINDDSIDFTVNEISSSDWTSQLEAHGAVFLPVTGQRNSGTTVNGADAQLHYWSSTGGINQYNAPIGNHLRFMPSGDNAGLAPDTGAGRCNGYAVRLVRDVE